MTTRIVRSTVKADKAFGDKSEAEKKALIENFFNVSLTKTEDEFAAFDFYNDAKDTFMELKTRRDITSTKYDTTLIGASKIANIKEGNKYVFIWAYTDGIFYLEYDKALWDTFECRLYKRFDRFDRTEVPKLHYFVPRKHLKPLCVY